MRMDDGIVGIYSIENDARPGKKPVKVLRHIDDFFFGFDTLGISRYYTALEAKQQIEAVINIYGRNRWIRPDVMAAVIADGEGNLERGEQFTIRMVQLATDEAGLDATKLSLERVTESYAFMS